jgi:hypothetical protein
MLWEIVGVSGVSALVLAASPSADEFQAPRPVTLHVRNAARIPAGYMSGARREVVRLYSGIGVMLTWEEHEAADNISHPPGNETMLLRVTILRDAPRRSPGSETLGAASLLPGESRIASMYHSRVERAARRYGEEPGLVLGHAIAHEVAHLIIPQYGHSSEGLMKAVWDVRDYQIAAQGRLCFSAEQAALIRAALAR